MFKLRHFTQSIRNSMIFYYLTTVIVILMLLGFSLYFFTKQQLEQEMAKRLVAVASMAANDMASWPISSLEPGDEDTRLYKSITNKLKKVTQAKLVSRIYVVGLDDKLMVDTSANGQIGMPDFELQLYKEELNAVRQGDTAHTTLFRSRDGQYYKRGFAGIYNDDQLVAILGVEAGAEFFDELKAIQKYLFLSIFFISLLIIAVSFITSEKIIQPIEKLAVMAKKIGEGDLMTPVVLPYKNEFGLLAASIDDMRHELKEKNERMQAMLKGIAHEVRNPLGGIELFAGLIEEDLQADQTELREGVEKIKKEVKNLKMLVNQFLDYSHDLQPQYAKVNAKQFLATIRETMELAAKKKDVNINYRIDEGIQDIWIDERLMKQALLNIVNNAIEAAPNSKGKVTVSLTKSSQLAKNSNIDGLEISVTDNGKGFVKQDDSDEFFRPFYTTKEKGSGLGLAFSQKIASAHEGVINIATNHSGGAKVVLSLPQPNNSTSNEGALTCNES